MTRIEVLDDPAERVVELLTAAAEAGGQIVLTGGSTPRRAYEAASRLGTDWSRATVWFSDERCVPPTSGLSNFGLADGALLGRLQKDQRPEVVRMEGELGPDIGAANYEAAVRERLGGAPRWDLLLLGLGADAHCASLFPGKPEVEERSRLVVGVELAGWEPQVPRISLTLPCLNAARRIVFLVTGADKAGAMRRAFGDTPDPASPAAHVRPRTGELLVLCDEAAAKELPVSDQFIGVDVGGTKVATATLQAGEVSESVVVHTDHTSQDALVEQLAEAIEAERGPDARAVGVGLPSLIEFATGRIRSSVNIPLKDLPLRELLTARIGLPVYVENDASCAALAEAFENGRLVCPHLVMFTLGTGVGGGIVLNGKLYRGARTSAAELGHTIIGRDLTEGDDSQSEPFPQRGTLEQLASGRALDRLAETVAAKYPDSYLGHRRAEDGRCDGTDVVDGAQAGDEAARYCLRVLGQRLGIGIANAINTFDPLEVVIGGGVSRAGDLLLEPARDAAFRHVVPGLGAETVLRIARHGPRAGVMGAALIAAQEYAEDTGRDLHKAIAGEPSP